MARGGPFFIFSNRIAQSWPPATHCGAAIDSMAVTISRHRMIYTEDNISPYSSLLPQFPPLLLLSAINLTMAIYCVMETALQKR